MDYSSKCIAFVLSHIDEKTIVDFVSSNTLKIFWILWMLLVVLQREPRLG